MITPRNILIGRSESRNPILVRVPTLLLVFTCSGLFGLPSCALNKELPSQPSAKAQPAPQTRTPANTPKSLVPSQSLQELSVREELGQTILLVRFTQPLKQYRHFALPQPSRIVLDILDDVKTSTSADIYRIDTNWVSVLRMSSNESNVRLVVDIAAATVPLYNILPEDGGLKIVIGPQDPNVGIRRETILIRGGKRVEIRTSDSGLSSRSEPRPDVSSANRATPIEKRYTGQKISLKFTTPVDVRTIFLALMTQVSDKNIIVTDDVNRKVTIDLKEVPWDQAMDLLIDTNGLAKEELGNVIRISTETRLKAERDQRLATEKTKENLEALQTVYFNVNYAKAKDLESKIRSLMTKRTDNALVVDERSNTIMVRDIQKSIEDVNSLVSKLDLRTPQVLIESNLIETTPTFSRALGIEIEGLSDNDRVRASSRFIANPPFAGGPQPTPTVNQLIIPTSGFRFGYFGNNITAVLSAAEAEGNVKIISRPSVVTLNNVESQIESANIVRIRTSAATVGEAGSLREIRAGITLKVTPQVSADGFVLLNITAKSSTLDFGRTVDGIPQENTREAKANVLVRDGETVVIGGIMKDTSSNSESGVPYLKEIPVLGWLFKKSSWQKDFEELVVFITPRVLAAGSENLPTAEQLWRDQLRQTQGTQAAPPLNP